MASLGINKETKQTARTPLKYTCISVHWSVDNSLEFIGIIEMFEFIILYANLPVSKFYLHFPPLYFVFVLSYFIDAVSAFLSKFQTQEIIF